MLDLKLWDLDDWFNLIKDVKREEYTSPFDVTGEYRERSSVTTPTRVPDIKTPDSESDEEEEEEEVKCPMPGLEPQELYNSDSDEDDDDVPPLSMMQHKEYNSSDSEQW